MESRVYIVYAQVTYVVLARNFTGLWQEGWEAGVRDWNCAPNETWGMIIIGEFMTRSTGLNTEGKLLLIVVLGRTNKDFQLAQTLFHIRLSSACGFRIPT
jgi:hypothetical protein